MLDERRCINGCSLGLNHHGCESDGILRNVSSDDDDDDDDEDRQGSFNREHGPRKLESHCMYKGKKVHKGWLLAAQQFHTKKFNMRLARNINYASMYKTPTSTEHHYALTDHVACLFLSEDEELVVVVGKILAIRNDKVGMYTDRGLRETGCQIFCFWYEQDEDDEAKYHVLRESPEETLRPYDSQIIIEKVDMVVRQRRDEPVVAYMVPASMQKLQQKMVQVEEDFRQGSLEIANTPRFHRPRRRADMIT